MTIVQLRPVSKGVALDLAIRGGHVGTAEGLTRADLGIKNGVLVQMGEVGPAAGEIDAEGLLVLPGGVDTHCHLAQVEPGMGCGPDNFYTGGRSALLGGTTTAISFISQFKGETLDGVMRESFRRGERSVIDYGFHQIITDPSDAVLAEVPGLVARGVRSLKVFLTYDAARLDDGQFLKVLAAARRSGAFVTVHCENYDAIGWLTERLLAAGLSAPKYHAWSRPKVVEREATYRAIALAELVDQPLQIFHVSCAEVAEEIGRAQRRGLKVWAETCPQYLTLTAADMDRPGFEGAKYMCSPAPRDEADHEGLWEIIRQGVIGVVSSDHSAFNITGTADAKDRHGRDAPFRDIPNGVPGVGSRLPVLFSEGVSAGRIDLETFVAITSTNPAKLFGLFPKKGTIAIGSDADLALWDPKKRVTITNALLQHNVDHTPWEGRTVTGWPVMTLLRGEVAARDGAMLLPEGSGRYLPRAAYDLIQPRGILANGFDAARIA